MHRAFVATCLLTIVSSPPSSPADDATFERWDRTVCLHSPGPSPEADNFASGFLVAQEDSLYLVTAGHAAQQTQRTSRLRFRCRDGSSQWVSLAVLFPENANPWVRHKSSDIATALIGDSDEAKPYRERLQQIAFQLAHLKTEVPRRTSLVEVAGFPFGFGIEPEVRPLVMQTHVASTRLDARNQWGTEPVIYSFPAIAQGTSGGPAFAPSDDPRVCDVVGMYVGVAFDASGGKLSKLIPAAVIRDAIASLENDGTR